MPAGRRRHRRGHAVCPARHVPTPPVTVYAAKPRPPRPPRMPPPGPLESLTRHLDEPLLGGNRVQLLEDGPATFQAMADAIDAARDHVNIESYAFAAEGPGEALAARLAAKARQGVRVNLLYDGFGSLGTAATFFADLASAGVRLCEYNPLPRWRQWLAPKRLHRRNHRKLMVVDGRVAFIGGVNITPHYRSGSMPTETGDDREPGWRDLHLRIEGPVVQHLQRAFVSHWQTHATCSLPEARYYPPLAVLGTQRVAVAAREAGRRRSPFYRTLLAALDASRSRILLTTAYLVPPRRLIRALVRAAERGVQVDLLLPGFSDFWAPLHAGRSHYAPLLRAGVRIHERHDTLLHAKACVVDGTWSALGSSNADWRSVLHNAEADVVVVDEDFAASVEAALRRDIAAARTIEPARWQRRARWRRAVESLARRFEFFL